MPAAASILFRGLVNNQDIGIANGNLRNEKTSIDCISQKGPNE